MVVVYRVHQEMVDTKSYMYVLYTWEFGSIATFLHTHINFKVRQKDSG